MKTVAFLMQQFIKSMQKKLLFPSVPLVETEYLAIALLAYCNACFICFHVCG